MSVLAEAISVIVPRSVLDAKYPGGLAAYVADCPNKTFCTDEHITRVGFMSPVDVQAFVRRLEGLGFVYLRGGAAIDVCVVDQHRGPTTPCAWLEGGKYPEGHTGVWMVGTDPTTMYAPNDWSPQQSRDMGFVASGEADDRMIGVARADGIETMLDLDTGREVFLGRARVAAPPKAAAPDAPMDLRSLKETIGEQLRESYKHHDEPGVGCARCGAADQPLAFHVFEKNFDEHVQLPRGAVPMSMSRGWVRTSFPLCPACAPPCRRCALPRLTDRVLEFGYSVDAIMGLGVCNHVQIRSLVVAIFRRLFRTGRFGRAAVKR